MVLQICVHVITLQIFSRWMTFTSVHQRGYWPSQDLIQILHGCYSGPPHGPKKPGACFNDPISFVPLQRCLIFFESCCFDFLSQSLPYGHVITGKCCRMEQVVISYIYAPCFNQNGIYINPSCQNLSCLSRALRSIGWITLNTRVLHIPFPPAQPCRKITVWIHARSVVSVTRGDPTVHRSQTTHDPSFIQQSSSRAVCRLLLPS